MKKDINKKEKEDYGDYQTNKKDRAETHEEIKKLGYDYLLEQLKKYGFSNPEKLAEDILKDKKE